MFRAKFKNLPSIYEEDIRRFPELEDIYEFIDELIGKYPEIRSMLMDLRYYAFWMSYYARTCDLSELVIQSEHALLTLYEIFQTRVLDIWDAKVLANKREALRTRVTSIYLKLSGAKPPQYPPVEGYIEV
jgi:hypothetical protein